MTFILNSCASKQDSSMLSQKEIKDAALGALITQEDNQAAKKKEAYRIQKVVVPPVANQTFDLTAPLIIRYFMEKYVEKRNYDVSLPSKKLDSILYQMGIQKGNDVNETNIREIGQQGKAEGIFVCELLNYRQDILRERTVIEAKFKFVETRSGRTLWQKNIALERNGIIKEPIRRRMTSDWTDKEIKNFAKSKAAELPEELVLEAIKNLPSAKDITKVVLDR